MKHKVIVLCMSVEYHDALFRFSSLLSRYKAWNVVTRPIRVVPRQDP